MQPAEVLIELKKNFSSSKSQRLIPALRRDPIIWAALQDDAYFQKVVAYAGDDPRKWSPAYLALLAIVDEVKPGSEKFDLLEQAKKSAEGGLRLFDETRQVGYQPKNMVEAAQLAIAMYQRFQLREPGKTLLQEIMPLPGEAERPALLTWQTPLACLLGMVEDPLEVLRSLMPKRISHLVMYWVCHAIFSNPFETEQNIELFIALLTGLPPAQQLSWLRYVNLTHDSKLVVEIAQRLLSKTSISSAQLLSKTNLDLVDIETSIVRSLELQRLAGLYRFANQPANARVMLEKAQAIVQHWLAGLSIQDADLFALEGQEAAVFASLQNSLHLGGGSNGMQSEILLSVKQAGQAEALVEQLTEQTSNPISQIFLASRIAGTGEIDFAREMAIRAVEVWLQQSNRTSLPFTPQFAFEWHPRVLVQALLDLQLPNQAVLIGEKLLEIRSADPEMHLLLSQIHDQLGDTRQALVYGQLGSAACPNLPEYHSWLATLWGKLGSWQEAYQEQQQAVFLLAQPQASDWVVLGRCAVRLKDWSRVADASDQALALNPDDGPALAMKGQSLVETGKTDEAGRYLSRATLLAPEEATAWLQMSRLYERQGNPQRSLETLRAAVLAVPASAEINFALAKICLNMGLMSDALPCLRKAAQLDTESVDIAVDLGQTLIKLGHLEEAVQVIEQARARWPQHPHLAYTHAQVALVNGNREAALKAIEVALESGSPEFDWYLLFARIILGKDPGYPGYVRVEIGWVLKAQKAMEKALELQPDHYEAQLLMAEVIQEKGDFDVAYQLFCNLMERPEFHAVEYRWRVQAGLGSVSLHLHQYENALASLQEAIQDQPDNLHLQHLLTDAYLASQLDKQALATAQFALRLAPDHLENLGWFTDVMVRMGELNEAIQALRTSTQLSPKTAANWLKLAELHLKLNDTEAAVDDLEKLLAIPDLDLTSLHQAARAYLVLDDPKSAMVCLLRVKSPDCGVNLEIAYLALEAGELETGLKTIQDAAAQTPDEPAVYVIEADLLNGLKRFDASLACLQHALRLVEPSQEVTNPVQFEKWDELKERGVVSECWLLLIQTEEGIHDRLAWLFRQMGDFNSALHHASLALELNPNGFAIRLQTAELCEALMMHNRLERVVKDFEIPASFEAIRCIQEEAHALVQLIAMRAEMAYESGHVPDAKALIEKGQVLETAQPRLQAMQARLCAWEGEWQKAAALLDKAGERQGIWLGKAALELYQWDLALRVLEGMADRYPANLQAQFWFARGLAIAALTRKTGQSLGLTLRLPGEHVLSEKAQDQFERASALAIKSSNREPARWHVIGRAIFHPSPQAVRALAALLPGETEAAALVACLREIGNQAGAIQVAEQYHDTPEVLLQLALCYMDVEPKRGFKLARKAAAMRPHSPFYQALVAVTAQTAEQQDPAFEAIEFALAMWPDEPEWHVRASELAEALGADAQVVSHWEMALELLPKRVQYAVAASKAFLAHQQGQKAIKILEEISNDQPSSPEIWYLLGNAYFQASQFKAALICAEKANQIEPDQVANVLLCGCIHLNMGHLDDALEWSLKAISLDEKDDQAVLFLAKVYSRRKNLKDALGILEKAIGQQIVSKEILLERAWLVYQINGGMQALPLLVEINGAYPDQVPVLSLLAKAEMETGNFPLAEQHAVQVLQLDPEQPDMNLLLGKLLRRSGQLDQAIACLSTSIRQSCTQADAFLELAQAYMDRRETVEALQVYQKAMKTIPQDYRPFYQTGLILRENKDYRGAETMLRRAADLSPDDLNIRRQLGAVITLNLIHTSQEASSNHETQRTQRL